MPATGRATGGCYRCLDVGALREVLNFIDAKVERALKKMAALEGDFAYVWPLRAEGMYRRDPMRRDAAWNNELECVQVHSKI